MSLVALLPLAWVRKPHLLADPLAEIAALDEKRRYAWNAAISQFSRWLPLHTRKEQRAAGRVNSRSLPPNERDPGGQILLGPAS
jgi:hypothetical protein